jgi:serine/threonine protein kinase
MFRWGRKSAGPALEPENIGRYRITRQLGQGGMGVVYAAHDDRLDRPVAIKRIREAADDSSLRERLLREARAAASINHPNVCHIYELAEEGRELYLVMELLTGEPLAERISRGPTGGASGTGISNPPTFF